MSGVPGMPLPDWAPELRPCGTPAAARRHYRRGEALCRSCKQAERRRWQDYGGPVRQSRREASRAA